MTPSDRARVLHRQAGELIQEMKLGERCAHIGSLVPTGSYFMDLMIYPDIDLYLPLTTPTSLLTLGATLAADVRVKRINYLRGGPGPLKNAFYLKPVIDFGDWERPWKIDIWSVDPDMVADQRANLIRLKKAMTPTQRELILETKWRLLTPEYRTPVFSGIFIYQAVIDQGITAFDEIVAYLVEQGIKL